MREFEERHRGLLNALPIFLNLSNSGSYFNTPVFLTLLQSTYVDDFNVANLEAVLDMNLRAQNVWRIDDIFIDTSSRRPFPYSLNQLVTDLWIIMVENNMSNQSYLSSHEFVLDATILIVSSGLLPFTTNFEERLLKAQNPKYLSKIEFYKDFCQAIIDDFLFSGVFSHRRMLDLSFLVDLFTERQVLKLLEHPFRPTCYGPLKSSWFSQSSAWNDEAYFNFIRLQLSFANTSYSNLFTLGYPEFWKHVQETTPLVVNSFSYMEEKYFPFNIKVANSLIIRGFFPLIPENFDVISVQNIKILYSGISEKSLDYVRNALANLSSRIRPSANIVLYSAGSMTSHWQLMSLVNQLELSGFSLPAIQLNAKLSNGWDDENYDIQSYFSTNLGWNSVISEISLPSLINHKLFLSAREIRFTKPLKSGHIEYFKDLAQYERLEKISIILNSSISLRNILLPLNGRNVYLKIAMEQSAFIDVEFMDDIDTNLLIELEGSDDKIIEFLSLLNSFRTNFTIVTNLDVKEKFPNLEFYDEKRALFARAKAIMKD